ncbi:MAG: hypothetical protein KC940_16395 [Candidatus Omnitrophica bacterium]|nr:hypothetical protein [Candidatus Omnitrophota bacterium]MCA9432093.1 hypothetical protein [Candidatus Omnitrophota bacterium]MCB9769397.1 hypothetical protein [Candidatus Omnitrophota bacterium]
MFGWKELTLLVADVYKTLPPEEQVKCGIYTNNYMQARAIDFFGQTFRLPHAISGHHNYWLWGAQGYPGEVMIVLGEDAEMLEKHFGDVTERIRFWDKSVQPTLDGLRVFVVRNPQKPLVTLWPELKHYI